MKGRANCPWVFCRRSKRCYYRGNTFQNILIIYVTYVVMETCSCIFMLSHLICRAVQAAKICNNMLLAIGMIGTAETMNLGIRYRHLSCSCLFTSCLLPVTRKGEIQRAEHHISMSTANMDNHTHTEFLIFVFGFVMIFCGGKKM